MLFFFPDTSKPRDKKLLSVHLFLLSQLLFRLHTYHMLLWQTIDCRDVGEESIGRKVKEIWRGSKKHWDSWGKPEKPRQTGCWKRKTTQKGASLKELKIPKPVEDLLWWNWWDAFKQKQNAWRWRVWQSHAGSHPSTTARLTLTRMSSN